MEDWRREEPILENLSIYAADSRRRLKDYTSIR